MALSCFQVLSAGSPGCILRVGNLGWDSRTGIANDLDFQSVLLMGLCRMGVAPALGTAARLELTPVDFVAKVLYYYTYTIYCTKPSSLSLSLHPCCCPSC